MERSELIAKLCKEAADTTPDIYNKILKAAESQGLMNANGAGASASGGESTSVNGVGGSAVKAVSVGAVKGRAAAAVAGLVAAIIATAAVAVPLALNVKDGLNVGPQIEAPDGSGGTDNEGGNGSGGNSGGQTPSDPTVPTPVNPNEVKSIVIQHAYGNGKYLWNEKDVLAGKYNLYGAQLEVTRADGTVSNEPITYEMFGEDVDFSVGNHDVTLSYGGKTAEISIFVSSDYELIEAVTDNYTLNGPIDTLVVDYEDGGLNFGGLSIEGEFNIEFDGKRYYGYYGETPVNERFVRGFDCNKKGMQTCVVTSGNMNSTCESISEVNVLVYDDTAVIQDKVFLSDVIILNSEKQAVFQIEVSPEKPYIDIRDIPDKHMYYEPEYSVELVFKQGDFVQYSGGDVVVTKAENIRHFDYYFYEISGDKNLWSVISVGERRIKLENAEKIIEVEYTVYDSDYTNIRFCRVHGDAVLSYELSGGVTLDSIKQELLTRTLYVEYFKKVNGKYVDFVPVTADMLDFGKVDINSYDRQTGYINYKDKGIGVHITRPYSVAGASILYNLTNTRGVNLILSDATVNDLGQCMKDVCKEIVLYDNGVAMLKHTGNGIGNVLTGYKLEGNSLTLLRHGAATSFLTVNPGNGTFDEIDLESVTEGMGYTGYTFNHFYSENSNIGWSATFTAYTGETGYDYTYYANVHLSGWASTPNEDGYGYQIAGVEYVATCAYGWHNNRQAFVLRFADKDWWFEIGITDSFGRYQLTLIKTVNAS